jgi:uncharacterized protein (TIGR02118 family)
VGWEKVIAAVPEARVPELVAGAARSIVHAPHPSERADSPYVVCLWFECAPEALPGEAYLVEELVQWELEPEPPVTRFSFLHRQPALTRRQFARHWNEVHPPLARRHHPCLVRYVQNVVVARLSPDAADIDGVAELSVRRPDDFVERMYDSPEGREIVGADVRSFIDLRAGWRVVTN